MIDLTSSRPTFALIDLDALAANFHAARKFIGPEMKYMAVVKANAYGHGAVECARRLGEEGVDWFGVALPEEGVELRRARVTLPILCLGSFWPGQQDILLEYGLTPVVYDIGAAKLLSESATKTSVVVDMHVKIDTGMHRLGVDFRQASDFADKIRTLPGLRVTGLLTHFAAAEDPSQSDFTRIQVERFDQAVGEFRDAGHAPEWIDLANSPGAITHSDLGGNMVRLGGALYGLLDDILHPSTNRPQLRPVMSVKSQIAYIREVARGEGIGYGRSFVAKRDSLIALVPVGYADGYPRLLSNRGMAVLADDKAPIVGRISMDWLMLDVTDVPNAKAGDEVYLIGGNGETVTAVNIAAEARTIGYEITCGISSRVPRVFLGKRPQPS